MMRFFLAFLLSGCATYASELNRGQAAFENNKYELSLAIFRALEPDLEHFDNIERARYSYLRGATDARLGYRADSRHWLAIAKELDENNKKRLPDDWRKRLDATLADFNELVYAGGSVALDQPVKKDEKPSDATPPTTEEKPPKPKEKEPEKQAPSTEDR